MAVRALPTLPTSRQMLALLDRPATLGRQLWQRARRSSRVVRARVGYAAGVALSAWGVGIQFGLGWALMAGGAVMAVSFLLLYPVEEPSR